ncbi:MAG: pantetheine-phosphate adenylyltransferase [Polyangiales bacterium]
MRGIAIYPGSFDPITKGHTSILNSGLVAFEKIIVAVLNNDSKKALFSVSERMEMIRESAIDMGASPDRIEVDSFDGLLVGYARRRNARVILRGLRAVADFEYELQMANMNRHLNPEVETVFIMANDAYFYVASNLVKEVARLGGNVSNLVPAPVLPRLLAKFDK